MLSKEWVEFTYSFSNFNDATVEVWEGISMLGLNLTDVDVERIILLSSNKAPGGSFTNTTIEIRKWITPNVK